MEQVPNKSYTLLICVVLALATIVAYEPMCRNGFVLDDAFVTKNPSVSGGINRKKCRQHVEKDFTIDCMVRGYEKVYEQIFRREARRKK